MGKIAAIARVCRGSVALAPQIGEVPFEWAGNSPSRVRDRKTEQFLDHCICKGGRSSGPGCNFKMPPEVAAYSSQPGGRYLLLSHALGAATFFLPRQLSVPDGFRHCKFALGALESVLIVAGFIGLDAR